MAERRYAVDFCVRERENSFLQMNVKPREVKIVCKRLRTNEKQKKLMTTASETASKFTCAKAASPNQDFCDGNAVFCSTGRLTLRRVSSYVVKGELCKCKMHRYRPKILTYARDCLEVSKKDQDRLKGFRKFHVLL